MGPPLVSSNTLMTEGLRCPVAEAALSQLFSGFSGFAFITMDLPFDYDSQGEESASDYRRQIVALALTSSGRLLGLRLNAKHQKRLKIFDGNTTTPSTKNSISNCPPISGSLYSQFVEIVDAFPPSPGVHRRGGPIPTFDVFMEALRPKRKKRIKEFKKRLKVYDDQRIGWSFLSRRSMKELKKIISRQKDTKANMEFRFFGKNILSAAAASRLTLHEYLQCNRDSLSHPTFAIGAPVNFERMKLETLPYWRHPELNVVYWSEALLDILTDNERVDTQGRRSALFIKSIGWRREAATASRSRKSDITLVTEGVDARTALDRLVDNSDTRTESKSFTL